MNLDCPCENLSNQTNEIPTSTNSTSQMSDTNSSVFSPWKAPSIYHKWPLKDYFRRTNKCFGVRMKKRQYKRDFVNPYAYSEISEGIPKKYKGSRLSSKSSSDEHQPIAEERMESIDIYYFDHGNSAFYRTTDSHPIITMEKCAEKTSDLATRFWAEIFGTIHIGVAFVVAFILQFFRFMLFSIVRPLTVGLLQLFADYFIKPFLSILFNALIQPVLILFYNILTSLRDLFEPVAEAFGYFIAHLTKLFQACRIIEIKKEPSANV